jgi:hypothetical protein
MVSFKDFIVVDYKPGDDELIKYAAHKRHRGRIGESSCSRDCGNEICETCGEKHSTDEALDFRQRRQRAIIMRKNKAKIAMGRRRAMKKAASKDVLMKRARRSAIKQLFTKFSKGKPKDELPASRRQEIEKRIGKMKVKVDRIAKRSMKDIRKREKERKMQKPST